MEVTIFQINGRVERLSNVNIITEYDSDLIEVIMKEGNFTTYSKFRKDSIAQIKIGGQHEYKKG